MIRLLSGLAALALAAMLFAVPASADYEQVGTFGDGSGATSQFYHSVGIAVNETGAGGVPAGSIYVVGLGGRVVRYTPGEENEEPRFEEAWGWEISKAPRSGGFERCGPAVADHPECEAKGGGSGGEEVGHFSELKAVAIDQANGYVYVRNDAGYLGRGTRRNHLIEVFTATGEPVGEGFGDAADGSIHPPESIEQTPGELHRTESFEAGLAVDEAGKVYLTDFDYSGVEPLQVRVMSFAPQAPGDYEHYVYTGRAEDIRISGARELTTLALVGADRLIVGSAPGSSIREYPVEAGSPAPICNLTIAGQLRGVGANRLTGEIFYATFSDRSIHRLGACDSESASFSALQTIKPAPEAQKIQALAVNASRAWGPDRGAGTLYGTNYGNLTGLPNTFGYAFAPAKAFPPGIESESVANTTTTSTTLEARIDPLGSPTEYSFQYLPDATYRSLLAAAEGEGKSTEEAEDEAFSAGTVSPPTPGEIPSGAVATATAPVLGLSADTAYAFRAVASSHCNPEEPEDVCEAQGAPASFSTYPVSMSVPPDGRAYELVSPAQKHGGEVFPADPSVSSCGNINVSCKPPGSSNSSVFPMQAAPDGEAVAYEGYPFSSTEGAAVYNSYLARRTATGWQTTAMSPALLNTKGGRNLSYGSSLDAGAVYQTSPSLAGAPTGYANIYAQSAADPGALTPLILSPPPHRTASNLTLEYAGATSDASSQYFAANDALIDEVPGIGVLPDPTSAGANPNGRDLYEWHAGQLSLINVMPDGTTIAASPSFASASPDAHAIAAGGRRVFWQAGGHLYVREDGQITREIAHSGTFLAASENGLRVQFSDGCLYSLLTESCTDLTQGQGGFLGVLGASEDLSRIYFADKAALGSAPEAGSCTTGSGQIEEEELEGKVPPGHGCNLYLYEAGTGISFIATLVVGDNGGGLEDWAASPTKRAAEASPSGRFLAFGSNVRLTGYNNVGPCGSGFNGKTGEYEIIEIACRETFLYDSASGRLSCPSCNPTGESPRGPSTLRRIRNAPSWSAQPRYLTDAGRLYFDSQDRLSPRDSNGSVEDVYEYEPQGVGSCERAGGCVALISLGTGSVDSNFLAMGETGRDVFFTSRERLVPSDTDELIDLYDAREGGLPAETETQRSECQGESCQPVTQPPNDPTPSSSSFHGAGNVREPAAPKKCPKGKVRKNGKCVKKQGHKKHAKPRGKHKRHQRANRDRRTQR